MGRESREEERLVCEREVLRDNFAQDSSSSLCWMN